MMLNPAANMLLPQLSPTNSSASSSSSDLDSESTGSFFHDRSTTLGTLMGVTFPSITFRAPSQHRDQLPSPADGGEILSRRRKRRDQEADRRRAGRRRWRWWSLCRDGGAKSASLGEFLEVERRFGDLEGRAPSPARALFSEGRVLPPNDVGDVASSSSLPADRVLCRFPVSIAGICCNCGAG